MQMAVPKYIFFTEGTGVHEDKLVSFEMALRDAGIQMLNLVYVSSIFPPGCKILPREKGISMLKPGEITFCVMAREQTCKEDECISAAVGLAVPHKTDHYGYLAEHHESGTKNFSGGEYAEKLAVTMLSTSLGMKTVPDSIWQKENNIETLHVCKKATGDKEGRWTTVISVAVFIP